MKKFIWLAFGASVLVFYIGLFIYLNTFNDGIESSEPIAPVKQLSMEDRIRKAIHSYYDELIQRDYTSASEWLAEHQFEEQRTNRAEWSNQMEVADRQSGIVRKGYTIKEFITLDDQSKLVSVTMMYSSQGEEKSQTDQFLMVKERGEWKLDFSGILKEERMDIGPFKLNNNQVSVDGFTLKSGIKQKRLYFNITNLRSDKALRLGVFTPADVTIHTSKTNVKTTGLNQMMVPPTKTSSAWIEFDSTIGTVNFIQISPLFWTDIDGVIPNGESSFSLILPINQEIATH